MKARRPTRRSGAGFTLIEVLIALAVLGVGVLAVAGVFVQGGLTSNSQADLTQATVVCQSKMEQLRTLDFYDSTSDTTQAGPPYPATGTGLAVGGSTSSAVTGYSDRVDSTGQEAVNGLTPIYNRWWQISVNATGTLKTIAVRCSDVSARGPMVSDLEVVTEKTCDSSSSSLCPNP